MSQEKKLGRHVFCFNPKDNGGEGLYLITDFFDNGDGEVFTHQEIALQSYCNSASFHLGLASLNPENLRRLANELDSRLARLRTLIGNRKGKDGPQEHQEAAT